MECFKCKGSGWVHFFKKRDGVRYVYANRCECVGGNAKLAEEMKQSRFSGVRDQGYAMARGMEGKTRTEDPKPRREQSMQELYGHKKGSSREPEKELPDDWFNS